MDMPEQDTTLEPMLAADPDTQNQPFDTAAPLPEPMLVTDTTDQPHFMLDPVAVGSQAGSERPTPVFTIYPPSFSDSDSQLLSESPASQAG